MPQRLLGIGVNEFPVSTPVAAPTLWQGPSITGTATFTNGSANVTVVTVTLPNSQFAGTDNILPGMLVLGGVSATGTFPVGTLVSTVTSSTVFTTAATVGGTAVNYPGTTGTYAFTAALIDPNNSSFANANQGDAIEPVTNVVSDSFLSIPNLQTIQVNGHYYIPPGQGVMYGTSGATTGLAYQFQNTAVGTWTTIGAAFTAAAAFGPVPYISDGLNFRILNAGTGTGTVTFIQTN